MHSTHSDGTVSPAGLVEQAAVLDLAAIAVTDHDTCTAIPEAREAGERLGVRVLAGLEISTELAGRTAHMLAYCFDRGFDLLRSELQQILDGREARNRKIVARLNELGCPITYEEVAAKAGGTVIGRPHFAAAMLEKGFVVSRQEAFDKYLGASGLAYFDRTRFTIEDAIALVRKAGGVAVLAHPKLIRLPEGQSLGDVLGPLVDAGLGGIECHYSLHSHSETRDFLELARRHNLLVTGGSDYHGANKPEIAMGRGLGELRVPVSCADALEAAAYG